MLLTPRRTSQVGTGPTLFPPGPARAELSWGARCEKRFAVLLSAASKVPAGRQE